MKTDAGLLKRIKELENQLEESEHMVDAIKYDKIDAFVITTNKGEQIFTLQGADRPYRIFLEQMNEGAITVSNDGTILYCNKKFADLLKVPLEKIIGTHLLNYSDPQDASRLKYLLANSSYSKEEISFVRPDKSTVSVYLSKTQLQIEENEPVLCIIATDLTDKKKREEIVAAEKLARSILEQAGEAIVVCDEKMNIIRANKAAEKLAGEPVLFKLFDKVFPLYDKMNRKISVLDLVSNVAASAEAVAMHKKNKEKVHLIINMGQLNGKKDHVLGYVINLTNITKHISVEEQLSASLKEKTVLLKEIHHRVKNNMQIISSLLALQAASIKEDSIVDVLNECRNRIGSMALIHQKLYESKSLSSVSITEYLRELIPTLTTSYQITNCNVKLDFPTEDILLTIEAAIPLGLIMNEIVTNSLKHAFKGMEEGNLCISLIQEENDIKIIVDDSGSGFPDHLDFYNPTTLGFQLIHTLVLQLDGSIELIDSTGTKIQMIIPRDQ